MIGKIVKIRTPYFDSTSGTIKFKYRPGLIIGNYGLVDNDYIALPVSKVTNSRVRHPVYDVPIDPAQFPLSNLTAFSYIRCHKQKVVARAEIGGVICDFKTIYQDKYLDCLGLLEQFDKDKICLAL